MKILLVNNQHFIMGGAHKVYFNTGDLLESMGHEVAYFSTLSHENKQTSYSKFFVNTINPRKASFFKKIKISFNYLYNKEVKSNLIDLINEFKPDIAHIHLFYGVLSISVLNVLKTKKIPIVHTVHDYRFLCPVNTFLDNKGNICEKCKNGKFYNSLLKKCSDNNFFQSFIIMLEGYYWRFFNNPLNLIDKFIFVSKFIENKHINFNKKYSDKAEQLYNFSPEVIDKKTSCTEEEYYLFFGRLSNEKGIETLIDAFIDCKLNLIIAGSGELADYVENFADKYQNIKYVGFKSGLELNNLIKMALYVVVPSEWYENNPMTIIEAYKHKTPVIGARIGGIPEIIIQGVTGFLFNTKDTNDLVSAIKLAENSKNNNYSEICSNAFNFANKNFNSELHYKKLIKIYNNVINK